MFSELQNPVKQKAIRIFPRSGDASVLDTASLVQRPKPGGVCQKRETLGEQLALTSSAASSCTQVVSNWVKVPLQISAHLVPQNATIFGQSISADVGGGDGLELGRLSPTYGDCCPQKTGEGGCDRSGRVSTVAANQRPQRTVAMQNPGRGRKGSL